MRYTPRTWWLWWLLWRVCMWMAMRMVSSSLTWYDLAYAFGRRCRAAGGPRITGFMTRE
jgi:hypothetical protein